MNKKPENRRSITAFIAIVFMISIVVTAIFCSAFNYREMMEDIRQASYEKAQIITDVVMDIYTGDILINDADSMTEEEFATRERWILRGLCKSFGFKYLYMVYPDEADSSYTYFFLVASDDEADERFKAERPFGTYKKIEKIPEAVINASNGTQDTTVWRQNNQYGDIYGWAATCALGHGGYPYPVIVAEIDAATINSEIFRNTVEMAAPVILILILVQSIVLFVIRRSILKPIGRISDAINEFAADPTGESEKLNMPRSDEIGVIASSYDKMTDDVRRYLKSIGELTAERVQNQTQMSIAERIQYGIVPEKTSRTEKAYNVYAIEKPSRQVGGDFYDCFMSDSDHLCLVMGDVSGKGISAALFMVMAKTSIKEKLMARLSPAEVLNSVNDELCAANPEGLFATVFAAVLNLRTGGVRYANAGHNPPLILDGEAVYLRPDPGIALGLFGDAGIIEERLKLEKGQGLLLYTDGVTEAVAPDRTFFGEERLAAALLGARDSAGAVGRVKEAVTAFYDGGEQFDDLTALAVFYENESASVSLAASLDEQDRINEIIRAGAGNSPELNRIILACEEVFTNIVNYSGAQEIVFDCERREEELFVVFTDNGAEFNAVSMILDKDFEDLDSGGMGLMLVRQIARRMEYLRADHYNTLKLTFRL